jgi:hypothetical protein
MKTGGSKCKDFIVRKYRREHLPNSGDAPQIMPIFPLNMRKHIPYKIFDVLRKRRFHAAHN